MWFHCDILDASANCFEIRIFSFTTYNSSVLWRMFGTSLVTLFNWCCNYLKERVMIQIQNFDASLRHLIKWIYFFVHMIAKQISDPTEPGLTDFEKSCGSSSCSHRLRWKRFSTLPWFPESVNFILRPLAFLCFKANTSVCGKISSLLESTWVPISFSSLYFPLWHFCGPCTSNMTFIGWLFKGVH